ncbi:Maltose acetyltransferase [Phytophthora boehmeriae]|uniref:Maltose acetyltransferase n=1 Tax=Phytophthora boehmeriae TaxID=109152 RepID=A0A8T1X833_9STRA|nr:Maltose acetyltransferase [Phytophthora boehmeriae]
MSSSTSSSGSEGSVEFPVGGSSNRSNVDGDTCAYYGLEPGESCLKPRTCYDCLNVAVKNNPEGCVLSQFGVCQSMVYYDPSWDYRTNGTNADSGSPIDFSGGLYHQFPAGNSTYCEDTDPACLMELWLCLRSEL